jgi:Ca-activated chloride channel homolog
MMGWEETFLKFIRWLNRALLILFLLLAFFCANSQSYLRGELRDENNNPLPNAQIILHSTGYTYFSGNGGYFGIMIPGKNDSLTISLTGYQQQSVSVNAGIYQVLVLKTLYSTVSLQKNRLVSLTKNLELADREDWIATGESYSSLLENEFIETGKYPETGFALRIDKASYSNIRRFLNMDTRVPHDAVRVEELMNYFNFGYTPPLNDRDFGFNSVLSDCPWNQNNRLLFVQLCAKKIDSALIPPSNLVFLVDVSGSMDMPNKLPLLKSAFKLLIDNLRDKDTVSIVIYGSAVGVLLQPTSGKEKAKIRQAVEDLNPGGSTPGASGIISAYTLAANKFIKNGNNRVILATDGDFNVGQSSDDQLEKIIISHQKTGIYLTCLGVGMGNYKDSKLEVLAKKGNGNFAYLDNEAEAEKVLVKELTQTLYSVADDADLSIRFNDHQVKSYRLIGYDNKLKALKDSLIEVEGGEVGSGHSMMALFELEPEESKSLTSGEPIANIHVRYHLPADSTRKELSFAAPANYLQLSKLKPCFRFAASVAMFGSLLRESPYAGKTTWSATQSMADASADKNDGLQMEFLTILEKARKIYSKKKRRRQ